MRARPLVWHLALFAAALVIPTLALIVLLFWHSAEAEQARIEQEVRDVAKAIAVALDRNLIAQQSMLPRYRPLPACRRTTTRLFIGRPASSRMPRVWTLCCAIRRGSS